MRGESVGENGVTNDAYAGSGDSRPHGPFIWKRNTLQNRL
jgi:hypothetical protein